MRRQNDHMDRMAFMQWVSGRDWWHGASDDNVGAQVARSGLLKPRKSSGVDYSRLRGKGEVASRPDRVYLTPTLVFALDYAIGSWWSLAPDAWTGADVRQLIRAKGENGWIFRVSGEVLASVSSSPRSIEPDEDAVGYAVYRAAQRVDAGSDDVSDYEEHELDGRLPGLKRSVIQSESMAHRIMGAVPANVGDMQYEDLLEGSTRAMAAIGKQMVRRLPLSLVYDLISAGSSVAVAAEVPISQALTFHRSELAIRRHDATSLLRAARSVPVGSPA